MLPHRNAIIICTMCNVGEFRCTCICQRINSHTTGLFSVHNFDFILKDVLAALFWEKSCFINCFFFCYLGVLAGWYPRHVCFFLFYVCGVVPVMLAWKHNSAFTAITELPTCGTPQSPSMCYMWIFTNRLLLTNIGAMYRAAKPSLNVLFFCYTVILIANSKPKLYS